MATASLPLSPLLPSYRRLAVVLRAGGRSHMTALFVVLAEGVQDGLLEEVYLVRAR
ncbi:hypothetical protein [Pyrobaculum sp.]|uniref:hypothetical protein n=1 Tax=Pyrobaculum sp. TaxID=2004705 RepID=UPI00319E04FB